MIKGGKRSKQHGRVYDTLAEAWREDVNEVLPIGILKA